MEQKQRPDETGKTERKPISVEEANSRAYQIGLQSDCIIKLGKTGLGKTGISGILRHPARRHC